MSTYLLTYNRSTPWRNLAEDAEKSASGVTKRHRWNAKHKDITTGDRVFLLKQGQGQTGIMAAGRVTSEPFFDDHWNERARVGAQARYVHVEFERILNPFTERLLSVADRKGHLATLYFHTRFSGRHILDDAAEELERLWSQHLKQFGLAPKSTNTIEPQHVELLRGSTEEYSISSNDPEESEFPEGKELYRLHRVHERNPHLAKQAKALALQRDGKLACRVCGFDFFKTYGDVGKDFIECHHTIPVSELTDGMKTKLSDVILVCSNCHRMLHRKRPWLRVADLKALLKK